MRPRWGVLLLLLGATLGMGGCELVAGIAERSYELSSNGGGGQGGVGAGGGQAGAGGSATGGAAGAGGSADGCGDGQGNCPPGMVKVVGGTYWLGGGDVTVVDLCVSAIEATVTSYQDCVQDGDCTVDQIGSDADDGAQYSNWGVAGFEDHPINCVNWQQATDYCSWSGARLPSLNEWTWFARSRDFAFDYPWGNTAPQADTLCWSGGNQPSRSSTCLGGSFLSSDTADPQGIHDVSGNVWDWTSTPFGGPNSYAWRGGSFLSVSGDVIRAEPIQAYFGDADVNNCTVGVRCVCAL